MLVFESTGFALYGAVASRGLRSPFELGEAAVSTAPDFATAVGEVLARLRERGQRLPKKALLVTPSAAAKLLGLPVDPAKPRGFSQMSELVRWELEEFCVSQNDIWTQGSLLMGRGHISSGQRREAEGSGQGPRPSSSGLYNDMVSREQLDECLELMELLSASDDELSTGWAPHASDGEEGPFTWWGAGIGTKLCARWSDAFRRQGVFLAWIYPQLGAAASLLARETESWLLVEVRQEQFALFLGHNGLLTSLALSFTSCGLADPVTVAEAARGAIHPETARIYLSAPVSLAAPILYELSRLTGREAALLSTGGTPPDDETCPPEVLASLTGAALHALGQCPSSTLVRVPAQPPLPPLWQNRELYPWLVMGLLLAVMAGNEWRLRSRAMKNEWELEKADIEYNLKMKVKKQLQSSGSEAKHLEQELKLKEETLKEETRLKNIFDNVIRHRQELVPGLLQSVAAAVNDEVVLDRVEELDNGKGFYLEAWALRDTAGQYFVSRLNKTLVPWEYKVGEMQFARGRGRVNIDGVILKIWLIGTDVATEAPK